jgi:hypothetical protein
VFTATAESKAVDHHSNKSARDDQVLQSELHLMEAAMPRLRVVIGNPIERIVSYKARPARTCPILFRPHSHLISTNENTCTDLASRAVEIELNPCAAVFTLQEQQNGDHLQQCFGHILRF